MERRPRREMEHQRALALLFERIEHEHVGEHAPFHLILRLAQQRGNAR